MKTLFLSSLLLAVLLFSSCEESCKIQSPVEPSSQQNYKLQTYGDYTIFNFGNASDFNTLGYYSFTEEISKATLAYKEVLNLYGLQCNLVEMKRDDGSSEVFFLSRTDKWIKLFSYCFKPFFSNSHAMEEFAPHFWQTLWTTNFSNTSFDTTIQGKYILATLVDTMIMLIPIECEYHYSYRYEPLPNLEIGIRPPTYIDPGENANAKGTKIIFNTYVKLTGDSTKKLPRFDKLDTLHTYNYDEFYFDNDRSAYLDKVEMHVYAAEPHGLLLIWIKHRTVNDVKTYMYRYSKSLKFEI